jgi:putative ABC transport system permease protein
MLKNYFTIMWRNLLKRKAFTLINLLGLASGMGVCLLLVLYIQNEVGYDNFHEHGDQIYRVALERKYPGRSAFRGGIPQSIGEAIKQEFPEVLEAVRVSDYGNNGAITITTGGKQFEVRNILNVDSNFFRVFSGTFLQGDKFSALQKPGTVVLNETTAKILFGSEGEAMNKEIRMGEFQRYTVTGVCKDWPEKSHFQFNMLLSNTSFQGLNRPEYVYFGPHTYLLLNKNATAAGLEAKLPHLVDKYVGPTIAGLFGEPYKQFLAEGNGYRYFLEPLKSIHLQSELEDEFRPSASMSTITLLGIIAAFILFLACVNFINLSTAISVERAREVGIRKTFGSRKGELIRQFLFESVLFSLGSLILAFLVAGLLTPLLNKITGNELSIIYFLQPLHLFSAAGFSVLIGLFAGLYPALILSSFDPMTVLKGRFKSDRRGIALRNGLVIFQFAVSVILIICTMVVNNQMQYVLGDKLGFKRDHIITLKGVWQLRNQQGAGYGRSVSFIDEISKISGVEEVSKCSDLPGEDESGGGATWVALDNNASRTDRMVQVDDRYAGLLDLQLKEGRFFSRQYSSDSLSLVLNEQAVKDFGLKNPIGARMVSKESNYNPGEGRGEYLFTVVGVVKDYHFQSLRKKIAPLIFVNANKFGWGSAAVRINGDHFKSTLASIEQVWKHLDAKDNFEFSFLDQRLAEQYKAEKNEQKIFTIFSLLAILIACVGLFGLAAYATLQRAKEISIRKVLGAMPGGIIVILSRDFLRLVIIAALIAFPVAWWAMNKWLQNFEYRVGISWWVFLLAGSAAALIALFTISFHAIRAAISNPLKSLRAE